MNITCIIIDDEPNALKLVGGYVLKIPGLQLKGQFFDAIEALEFLRINTVDIIFTDIEMPILTGLELAGVLPKGQRFIFTTAYQEYAMNSFDYYVVDYLLKPITFVRFKSAVDKIALTYNSGHKQLSPVTENNIFVRSGGQLFNVRIDDILYIKGEREYVSFHFADKRLLVFKRMKEMEMLLPPNFQRIHLSYIANMCHVKKLGTNYLFAGNDRIPVSSSYKSVVWDYLGQQTI